MNVTKKRYLRIQTSPSMASPLVSIVAASDANQAEWVICLKAGARTPFIDNVEATCSVCTSPIIHRPDVPAKPPKICIDCARVLATTDGGTVQ